MEFNATFLVSIISFLLFTLIMNKIFYKPLQDIMTERQKFINDNYLDAKFSNKKADEISKDREDKLAKSLIDAKKLIAQKVNEANENSRTVTDSAKAKSREDIKSAKELLLEQVHNSESELEAKIEELSEVIYSKIVMGQS